MTFDGPLDIATGLSAGSRIWKNKTLQFSEFVKRVSTAQITGETHKEFIAANKQEQGKIKDVGGYVGGYLRNGRRSPANVVHRQLLTLDIDFAHIDFWEDFRLSFGCAAILHSTHKHCEADPRYRLIIPLSREVTADEYGAISRRVAGDLNIELFDRTTFETNRLMFWPSVPSDVEYYLRTQDGAWLDADAVLARYIDWKDTSLWPTADRTQRELGEVVGKQEDPREKRGIVGAFCRTYGVEQVIGTFLSEQYVPATEGRYTYTKGSTAAGLILYGDEFAYSHHGTDPCSGKLCNSFDLVRLHMYGHLDANDERTGLKTKSFLAMEDLARKDKAVKKTIAAESLAGARYDFATDEELSEAQTEEAVNWMSELESDSKNKYLSTATNIDIIIRNDPRLKEVFRHNDFDSKRYVFSNLPWRRVDKPEPVLNVDYSGIRNYIEGVYGISGTLKIDDSMALAFHKQSFHPVRDFLDGLAWDGTQRIDRLLVDYFGAADNVYTHEAIRKHLVAAVARIYLPGCKYDTVLTLVGEQGTGKSTFIKKLGKAWYSDTFMTVHGKEAFEQIQGVWHIEMAELAGLRKADVESQKHFVSKQEDTFRPAYARTAETFARQCIFWATTNIGDFLKDPTGNRRFNPIDVLRHNIRKNVFSELDDEVDQIWAEAVHLFRAGEPLYLGDEAQAIAQREQAEHSEVDERKGLVDWYLNTRLPKDWAGKDVYERRDWLGAPEKGITTRDYVCIAEIWCECLGKEKENMSRYNTREINDIMKGLPDWEQINSTRNFTIYGKQKYYIRKLL